MELHEVKIGDIVSYKDKSNRTVKGKVVHRFEGDDKPHLAGHVNVQSIDKSASYPKTIHVSNLTPCFEEGISMEFSSLQENIAAMLADIRNGENMSATEKFNDILSAKVDEVIMNTKINVANALFNPESVDEEFIDDAEEIEFLTQEEFDALSDEEQAEFEAIELDADQVDEALIGGQRKIDINRNGKLDAQDFKMLRAKKGMKEEVEQIDELSKKTLGSYIRKAGNDSRDSSFELGALGGLTSNYAKKAIKYRKDSVAKRNKGINNAVSKLTKEAYTDPYAAKKAAEMKKAHSEKIKGIKKEFDADKSLPNPFMKLKKDDARNRFEEVELMDEGNAENKAKKNAHAEKIGKRSLVLGRSALKRGRNSDINTMKMNALGKHVIKKASAYNESVEQMDEGNAENKAAKNAFVSTLSKKGYTNMLKKGRDTLKGDPYVIKHANKMKAARYDKENAAFKKLTKEEVQHVDEANAENKAKKNAFAKELGTKALSSMTPQWRERYRKSNPGDIEGAKTQVGRKELRGYAATTDKIAKRAISKNPSEYHKRQGTFSGRHLSSPRYTHPEANEEVQPVNEKLTDTVKKVLRTAIAHNMSKNKKTSAQARAMIKIAKMNPANTVRKEEYDDMYEGNAENKAKKNAHTDKLGDKVGTQLIIREPRRAGRVAMSGKYQRGQTPKDTSAYRNVHGGKFASKIAREVEKNIKKPNLPEQYVGTEMQTLSRSTTMTEALKEVAHNSEVIRQGE